VASLDVRPGRLVIDGDGSTLDDPRPRFLGRRQLNQTACFAAVLDAADATGGLAVRYDEDHHYDVEATGDVRGNRVVARARLATLVQEWTVDLPAGEIALTIEAVMPPSGFGPSAMTSDSIRLSASAGGETVQLAEVDGRYLSAETAASFTGRVAGVYAVRGSIAVRELRYRGSED
jgi:hypothetical protein